LFTAMTNAQSPFDRVKAAPAFEPLLRDGYERSPTLRQVIDEIATSRWLVFVQTGKCPEKTATACLLHFIGRFEDAPYLRVIIKHRHRHPDNLIASLAHELQHAREIVRAPAITDGAAIRDHFKQIGSVSVQRAGVTTYETAAALAVGDAVWRELLRNTLKK
jgi:hypothetical protein